MKKWQSQTSTPISSIWKKIIYIYIYKYIYLMKKWQSQTSTPISCIWKKNFANQLVGFFWHIYILLLAHTHTHTHIYIYIYIYNVLCVNMFSVRFFWIKLCLNQQHSSELPWVFLWAWSRPQHMVALRVVSPEWPDWLSPSQDTTLSNTQGSHRLSETKFLDFSRTFYKTKIRFFKDLDVL